MIKRICCLLTLIVLVSSEFFIPMNYVLAENNAEQDFQVEENISQEDTSETEEDIPETEEDIPETREDTPETGEDTSETEENTSETEEDISETEEDTSETEEDVSETREDTSETREDTSETEEDISETRENTSETEEDISETREDKQTNSTNSSQDSKDITSDTQGNEDKQDYTGNTSTIFPEGETGDKIDSPASQSGSEVSSGNNVIDQEVKEEKNENEGIIEEIGEEIGEEIQEIVTKIRYFFKKGGDSRYIKYGRDSNNIGTITLKDPKNGASITIMDKNLGANSIGDNGYYFQWGNNSGVKTVNSSNKTTKKAVYKDSYYSHGYDGGGKFIIGGTDYWENGAHYNNLWGNESKESSRYGACPVGYHIPTVKEWNQLLSIWGKIHTQDTSTSEMVLRYSANYATKNIHTFKGAATQCEGGESECVNEDKLSIIIDTLSDELKLPLAGSYDENGNFHDGLGVYWTSISKDGNKAGIFDMNAYIGNGEDDTLMYKAQGHNIRCFQNIQPYEAPIAIEIQEEEKLEAQNGTEIGTGSKENPLEEASQENKEGLENQKQDSYSGQNIPSEFISYSLVLDTAKDLIDVEMNANGGRFSDNEETKVVKYGYYNQETTIDIKALKQDEYRSGYDIESEIEKISPSPVGYKLMDKVEAPEKEGYIFDGWYTELEGGEKVDLENLSVSEGMKVYAHWTAREYTITRKNEDGTIKDTTKVAYGQIPTHEDITQPSDSKYTYTFKGWEPGIKEVTGDAEYRATYTYTLRKYTVTWEDENGKVLKMQQIEYGTMPTYNGEIPTKESTEDFEYTFAGWDKEISEVKGNAKYIAKYDAKEIIKEDISTLSHDDENILSGTIERGSEGSNDGGRGGNIQNSLSDSLELKTGDVESGSALDLLEEIIEAQTETGEVLEYTQEDREMELAQIWETLNKQAIEGKKASHHVIVKVSAPVGAFPEGTELRITPIESLKMMQEIKDQLVENTDVTEESELVSFDISFIYTLSNGEEIELQPLEGQTVKVSFNFTYNDTLSQADSDSDKELKVYHLEEVKDESGKKTEEVEVKEVKVNTKESSEGELVVDAEKFSVYTIVDQIREETGNQLANFKYGVITISGGTNNDTCYTFMDRNLGATTDDINDINSYGYYYQMGNNYGFTLNTAQNSGNSQVTTTYQPSQYSGKTFITQDDWYAPGGDPGNGGNIWGGGSDADRNTNKLKESISTNYDERQGPCPNGWHVPAAQEWAKVLEYWYGKPENSGYTLTIRPSGFRYFQKRSNGQHFQIWAKIPLAGNIGSNGSSSFYGTRGFLRTSSAFQYNSFKLQFGNIANNGLPSGITSRFGVAIPVRCFYNSTSCSDIPEPTISDGGECETAWGATIADGQSVTGYQSATVPYGQSCVGVQAICNNGTWSVNNFETNYPYSGCTVADPVGCTFAGTGIAHNGSLTVYSSASPTCPTACTAGTVTCNNGTLGGDTSYTNLSCATVSKTCDSSYTLSSEGSHGTYSSCTPSIANGTTCTPGTTKYKLDSCDSGYHTEDGETCISNTRNTEACAGSIPQNASAKQGHATFNQTWSNGTWSPASVSWTYNGSECGYVCNNGYHTEDNATCIENTRTQNCSTFNIDHATATVSTFTQTWNNGTWTPATKAWTLNGSECGFTCNTNYTWDGDSCEADTRTQPCGGSIPENASAITASTYTQTWNGSSWTPTKSWTNGADICGWSCDTHYHLNQAGNGCDIDTFQITWKDGDGHTLTTDTVNYNVVPTYNGVTPTKTATAQYTYTWNETWSPTPVAATADAIYTAQFDSSVNNYTVTVKSNNTNSGSVDKSSVTVPYGTSISINGNKVTIGTTTVTATPKTDTAQWDYEFVDWTNTCGNTVTTGCSITANFKSTLRSYTVTWKNEDGTVLETDNNVVYGTTPTYNGSTPTKPRTDEFSYTFAGWSPEIVDVEGNQEYTAQFRSDVNNYTVSVKSNNTNSGTVDKSSVTVPYGTGISINGNKVTIGTTTVTANPKTDTAQWDYEFVDWTNTCGNTVTTGCSITANFKSTLRSYTVTWKNEDGTVLETDTNVVYGTTPTYNGSTPTKPRTAQYTYTFDKWTPTITSVTGNITYTATYKSTVNEYTVNIASNNTNSGTVDKSSVTVPYGTGITINGNKVTIGSTTVTATPKTDTAQWDFEFENWTNTCGNTVTTGCSITANFKSTLRSYTVTWKNEDGTTLKTDNNVVYGTTPTYNGATPTKAATTQYTYTFAGWSPEVSPVTGNITYTATYTSTTNKYLITFKNRDGTELQSSEVAYGTKPTAPANPSRAADNTYTYTFKSWTPSIHAVSGAQVYTATYDPHYIDYTITWKDYNGTQLSGATYHYNDDLVVLADPSRAADNTYTYQFAGWTPSLQNKVTGNKTYTATYTPKYIDYTITFVNWDNSEISSRTYHYGDTVTVPADPRKPADEQYTYRFTGWSPEVSNVTKSQVYTATYSSTVNQYTATINVNSAGYGTVTSGAVKKDWGTDISVEGNTLTIGTTTITAAPTSRSDEFTYTFSGWTNNCGAKLTGDCTITANFKRTTNEYLITFKNRDGTELQSSEFEYGTTPSYTGTPTRPADEQYSYSFSGWSPAIYPVNGVQVYTAVYTNKINKYDVIFDSDGGDYTPTTQSIEYGSTATRPTPDPTKTGYEFTGWTLNGSDFDFSTPIMGTTNLVAKRNLVEYTITYNMNGGTNNPNNPDIYTIESGAITLQQPTKTGYTFLGWTGNNGDNPQTGVVIPTGSYGDKEYNAVWQANTNTYTVYHYVKKVGENTYVLSKTDILTGTTDEILILSSLAKESEFICAHYSSGSLTGTENGPGEIITETTIKGDGSTKIYLYYTRNSYTVTLSGDEHVQMLKINGTETNQATLECGSEVPVEAVPKPGYHFVRWDREEKEEKENSDEGPP